LKKKEISFSVANIGSRKGMRFMRWMYKVWVLNDEIYPANAHDLELVLNKLGAEKWELISVLPQIKGEEGETKTQCNAFIFKQKVD